MVDGKSDLLNVTLDGTAQVLLQRSSSPVDWAIPSPDGRWLALSESTGTRDAWAIHDF